MKRIIILLFFICTARTTFAEFVPIYKGFAGGVLGVDALRSQEVPPSTQTHIKRNKTLGLREFVIYLPPGYFQDPNILFQPDQKKKKAKNCGLCRIDRPASKKVTRSIVCPNDQEKKFPVVYFLDGDSVTHLFNLNQEFVDRLDLLISSGLVTPLVLVNVASDTTNPWGPGGLFETDPPNQAPFINGQYTNSPLTGNFEPYITRELRCYVDEHYRTRQERKFTGIFGYSQGGYGALVYAAKHPDIYGMLGIGAGLRDYIERFIPGFAGFFMAQKAMGVISDLTPNTNENALEIFAESAARSPQSALNDASNPGSQYGVALPFDLERQIFDNVVDVWRQEALDTIIQQYAAQLQTVKIMAFNGVKDRNLPYVDARRMFDLFDQNNIPCVFMTHEGDHFTVPTQLGLPLFPLNLGDRLPALELQPQLQFFSACMLSDDTIASKRSVLQGVGTIQLTGNTHVSIVGENIIAVESSLGNPFTDITVCIKDNAQLNVGTTEAPGGAFQVGNDLTKQDLIDNPALQNLIVNFGIEVNGPNARMSVGKRGFFGFGVGLRGKGLDTTQESVGVGLGFEDPEFIKQSSWVIASLQSVNMVNLNIAQGSLRHQCIVSSESRDASLMAFGQAAQYDFDLSDNAGVFGGGNIIKLVDSVGTLANVTTTVESPFAYNTDSLGLLYPFTVDTINMPASSFDPAVTVDPFGDGFPFPLVTRNAPFTGFERQLLASTPLIRDPNNTPVAITGSVDDLFEAVSVTRYKDQLNKRCAAAREEIDGNIIIGYTNESTTLTDFFLTQTFLTEIHREEPKVITTLNCSLQDDIVREVNDSVDQQGALTIRIGQSSKSLQANAGILES